MTVPRHVVVSTALAGIVTSVFAGAPTSALAEGSELTLRLTVPHGVSAQAARRAAGDPTASPPILILEGVEVGTDEGLTIRVLGPPEPGSPAPILAVTSTVGKPQATPRPPLQNMTLAVPLNDRASLLLVGRSDVILTLKVMNSPGRSPIKIDRAFFLAP